MARRKKKISKPRKETFAIIVDGKTEFWYFQMLKRNEPDIQVNIEPKIPQKKRLSEQYEKVLQFAKDYSKVFWIIDLDVVIAESKTVKKGKESQIQKLKKYFRSLRKIKNVTTIINNPCLEFWFLLHFKKATKYFASCSDVGKQLKKELVGYEKTKKYFTKESNDIYLKLLPKLPFALENSRNTQRQKTENFEYAICEMNLFFESIGKDYS